MSTVQYLLQQIANGIVTGSVYALIAIGYTMVYGVLRMINFAHGEIFMVGAFVSLIVLLFLKGLVGDTGLLPAVLALLCSLIVTGSFGWVIERFAYRRLRESFRLAPLISAIGISIFLQNAVQLLQGARPRAFPPILDGTFAASAGTFVTIQLGYLQLVVIALAAAVSAGFALVISSTRLGRAQRAVSEDQLMASLLGVSPDRTIATTFVIGACLAAVAGFISLVLYGAIDFYMGFAAGLRGFTAAVLGGIGSLPGAMLGGIFIGVVESLWAGYFPPEYRDVAVFGLLLLVLIVRPSGFFGRPEVVKV